MCTKILLVSFFLVAVSSHISEIQKDGSIKSNDKSSNPTEQIVKDCGELCMKREKALEKEAQMERNEVEQVLEEAAETYKGETSEEAKKEADHLIEEVLEAKKLALEKMGIGKEVHPIDDGLWEGDEILSEVQLQALTKAERQKRSVIAFSKFPTVKWEGEIPFVIEKKLKKKQKNMIRKEVKKLEKAVGCLSFKEVKSAKGPHIYFGKFSHATNCGVSPLGKMSTVNKVLINFGCKDVPGRLTHELLHSLGIEHQQNRRDRDKHLKIKWGNILPGLADWFALSGSQFFTTYGRKFNAKSIMQYHAHVGAKDPKKPTMVPKDKGVKVKDMGQRKKLQRSDIALLRKAYCCKEKCQDKEVDCGYYANMKRCKSPDHAEEMKKNCQKSCGFCKC